MVDAERDGTREIALEIRRFLPRNRVNQIAAPMRKARRRDPFDRPFERGLLAVAPERGAETGIERLYAEADPAGEGAEQGDLRHGQRFGVRFD